MKTYAVADLHGCYNLYEKIKEYIQPEDMVYFLGDAIDRGPDSWKLMKTILGDPQFDYLMGNHEDMFVDLLKAYEKRKSKKFPGDIEQCSSYRLVSYNGGADTVKSWVEEGEDFKWKELLGQLPLRRYYTNKKGQQIALCHAGFTPGDENEDLLWDRDHFYADWDEKNYPNVYVVHGHTPWYYLDRKSEENPHMITYANGHKMDIDCGSFFTGTTCLLDLDTFEPIYFK